MLVSLLLPKATWVIVVLTAYCRLPNTIKEIEKYSKEVLKGLLSTIIVVMSLLANNYTDLI
jgi:hypothetical protein